jgi:hypothetical protein
MSTERGAQPGGHALRRFFRELVARRFDTDLRLHDPGLAAYVSGLLAEFTHVDSLYRIRDARGRRLEDVGEMLLESNPLLAAASFDRERAVRKHVGDYVLFMAGLFPESLSSGRRLRQARLDAFVDYVKAGKESYGVVAAFDQFEYAGEAPLFRKLAENFELCVFGLNLVKEDLERSQRAYYRGLRGALEG